MGGRSGKLQCCNGKVAHAASNRSLTYGELADAAGKLTVPDNPKLKDPDNFTLTGKSLKRFDNGVQGGNLPDCPIWIRIELCASRQTQKSGSSLRSLGVEATPS
jgi:hypothetical protein